MGCTFRMIRAEAVQQLRPLGWLLFVSRRLHTRFCGDWSSDVCFFVLSRRRHTRCSRDWSSDVCSSDLAVISRRRDLTTSATSSMYGLSPSSSNQSLIRSRKTDGANGRKDSRYLTLRLSVDRKSVV